MFYIEFKKEVRNIDKDLLEAVKEMNRIDTGIGITLEELIKNKKLHGIVYFDKYGFSWKYNKGNLMYSDNHYKSKRKYWDYANMDGCDLPYKKFLTLEEFEANKPFYLYE